VKAGCSRKVRALTKIEVLIVIAVLMLLAVFWIMPLISLPYPNRAPRISCQNNLKQIGITFRIWAGDNGDKIPMQVSVTNGGTMEYLGTSETFRHFQVMSNELGTPRIVFCPAETKRDCATNFSSDFGNNRVSYFIVVSPPENDPSAPMAGDRNLTLDGTALTTGWHFVGTNAQLGWNRELHNRKGNVLMADASVLMLDSTNLPAVFRYSSMATNHLAIP
jgi:prepilin-type processing-associated H-X9-DG protein